LSCSTHASLLYLSIKLNVFIFFFFKLFQTFKKLSHGDLHWLRNLIHPTLLNVLEGKTQPCYFIEIFQNSTSCINYRKIVKMGNSTYLTITYYYKENKNIQLLKRVKQLKGKYTLRYLDEIIIMLMSAMLQNNKHR
jgi:hypothetical protein